MGKRGPAPRGEFQGKTKVLSTRIRPDTRAALVAAAEESGRSLSQEIESRLRGSFADEEMALAAFGSKRNRAVMKLLAIALSTVHRIDRPDAEWWSDPYLFDRALETINRVLNAMRPEGEAQPPKQEAYQQLAEWNALSAPAKLFYAIQTADPQADLQVMSEGQRLQARLQADLGELARRPRIFHGTADDMRAEAARLEAASKTTSRGRKSK